MWHIRFDAVWHIITDEVIRFVMDIPGNVVENNTNKTRLERRVVRNTDEVIHFVMDILGNVTESNTNKTCLERRVMLRLTQPMSVVVTVTVLKKVWRR